MRGAIGACVLLWIASCGSGGSQVDVPDAAVAIDECVAGTHDCDPNATCTDDAVAFTCGCNAGYTGDGRACTYAGCAADPCRNGATCTDGDDTFACTCADGFEGSTCETNVDDCAPLSCRNGGTCVDGIATYTCTCPHGTLGPRCERLGPPLVGAYGNASYAIRSDGTLWYWGRAVGSGSIADTSTRVGTFDDWRHIVVGPSNACGLRGAGALWCWGDNANGQLGIDSTTPVSDPTAVGDATWLDVAIGDGFFVHACGVQSDGSLWCWGYNGDGRLGLGSAGGGYRLTPQAVGVDLDWLQVATGDGHSCAIKSGGTLWCWGDNLFGQTGDTISTSDKLVPTQVGTDADWVEVRAHRYRTCARRAGGGIGCWGNGNLSVGSSASWARISVGANHVCGTRTDGSLWCWGLDQNRGQLGVGDLADRATPAQVGSSLDWRHVSAGSSHTCGIRATEEVWCWGHNGWGELGGGVTGHKRVPTQIGATGTWSTIDAASTRGAAFRVEGQHEGHVCARRTDGSLWCWGANDEGQLGDGSLIPRQVTAQVGTASDWLAVKSGGSNSCALRADGSLHCWGCRSYGFLNCLSYWGGLTTGSMPTAVGAATTWQTLSGGALSHCGTQSGGKAACWGNNTSSQLGNGGSSSQIDPVEIGGTSPAWSSLDAGSFHACAVREDGADRTRWCWGTNGSGRLGNGGTGTLPSPTQVGSAVDWISVSAGDQHTCGLRGSGTLWCWGENGKAQLGDGSTTDRLVETPIGSATDWLQVSAGELHTCAIRSPGTLWCWGNNTYGALGLGDTTARTTPTQVGVATDWTGVSAGEEYTCGNRADGSIWCWGNNDLGQLGDGTAWSVEPSPVQ